MYQPTRGIGGSIEEYHLEKHLGKGGFADVFLAREAKSQARVAIKRLQKDVIRMGHNEKRVQNEINIHYKLKHPNICELFRYFEDDNFYYLIMEYCAGGELNKYIRQKTHLNDNEAKKFFSQLVNAVCFLHSKNILHRDIKLTNILLTDKNDLKLADFGLSAQLEYEEEERFTMCGTPNFIAPEIVEHKNYSFKTDVWSLGVVLFFFLTGKLPFEVKDKTGQPRNTINQKTLSRVKQGHFDIPDYVSADARDLLNKILVKDPYQRFGLQEILSHSWLQTSMNEKLVPQPKKPLNTKRLKPVRTNKYGSILETGEFYVETKHYEHFISSDGLEIRVTDKQGGMSMTHQFHSLPSEFWPMYNAASKLVYAIRRKTAKVVYYSEQCKACYMESMDDLRCIFYNGTILEYTISSDKWTFVNILQQFELKRADYLSHANYCLSRCKSMEKSVSSNNIDDFPLTFGTNMKKTSSPTSSSLHMSSGSIHTRSTRSTLSTLDSMSAHSGNLSIPGSPVPTKDKQMYWPGTGWCYIRGSGEITVLYSGGESVTLSADCRKLQVYQYVQGDTSTYMVNDRILATLAMPNKLVDLEQKLEFITKFKAEMYQFDPL